MMTITNERLQELLSRASMAESMEITPEFMDEYREILRMAMTTIYDAEISKQLSGF